MSRPRIPWVVSLALALWAVPRSAFPQPYARFDVPDSTLVGTLAPRAPTTRIAYL